MAGGLHHVGHIVMDMDEAIERYRRLGFTVAAPAFPVLPGAAGEAAEGFGVANTHVYFPGNFVELVAVIGEDGHVRGRPIPLRAPDDKLPGLVAAIRAAAANVEDCLRRFQGLHILMADTSDIDAVAWRLADGGVVHGGVHAVRRPVETDAGTRMEPARYLEVSHPGLPAGRVPEGRVGFAENTPVEDQTHTDHPNGATGLVECVLCVADPALPELGRRYGGYFGEATPGAGAGVLAFERADVTVVAASALDRLLPGERTPGLPAFVAYAVSVRDVAAAERLLRANGVPVGRTGRGELFVPAGSALGVAIIFR